MKDEYKILFILLTYLPIFLFILYIIISSIVEAMSAEEETEVEEIDK